MWSSQWLKIGIGDQTWKTCRALSLRNVTPRLPSILIRMAAREGNWNRNFYKWLRTLFKRWRLNATLSHPVVSSGDSLLHPHHTFWTRKKGSWKSCGFIFLFFSCAIALRTQTQDVENKSKQRSSWTSKPRWKSLDARALRLELRFQFPSRAKHS